MFIYIYIYIIYIYIYIYLYIYKLLSNLFELGCSHHLLYGDVINFFRTSKCQRRKQLYQRRKTSSFPNDLRWISMNFSGKLCLMIILKVTKTRALPTFYILVCVNPPLKLTKLKIQAKTLIEEKSNNAENCDYSLFILSHLN